MLPWGAQCRDCDPNRPPWFYFGVGRRALARRPALKIPVLEKSASKPSHRFGSRSLEKTVLLGLLDGDAERQIV